MGKRKLSHWLLGGALVAASVIAGAPAASAHELPGDFGWETVQTGTPSDRQETGESNSDPIALTEDIWEWG